MTYMLPALVGVLAVVALELAIIIIASILTWRKVGRT
jgi:hypothetical protein